MEGTLEQGKTTKQVNKEERELGMSSHEDVHLLPELKRTKLDVDDPNITEDDNGGSPSLRAFLDSLPEPAPMTREEKYESGMLKVIDEELAASGVDIVAMRERWKTCKEKCTSCGEIDYHPTKECPYGRFIYI